MIRDNDDIILNHDEAVQYFNALLIDLKRHKMGLPVE